MSALPIVGERGAGSGSLPGNAEMRIAREGTAPRSPLPQARTAPYSLLPGVALRTAVLADVPRLEALMSPFIAAGDLLPRSNYDVCRHIKEYVVAEAAGVRGGGGGGGEIVACGSLKIYSQQLAEVAGLAVRPEWQGAGFGRAVVEALILEARAHGLTEVLALTRKPAFFFKLGFAPAQREHFPLKVWADCNRCPRNDCCDEVAVTLKL